MKKRKKLYAVVIIICVLLFNFTISLADEIDEEFLDIKEIENIKQVSGDITEEPNINSRAAIAFDRNSKTVIYEKNMDNKRAMASTTKIMTSIVAIEKGNLDDIVEVSKKAGGIQGSRLGLKAGDKITLKDLLYGLMLVSGNDAAVAIAEHVGGDVEGFATLMNNKAKELNLHNTHFITPHGLDNNDHYTTAYELALITDYALNNPFLAKLVNTKSCTVTINGYRKDLNNSNELLGVLNGVNGVKTGFTNNAGRCLVTSVKRDSLEIICVVLGADTKRLRTSDSTNIIEYIYKTYQLVNIEEIVMREFSDWQKINSRRIVVNKGKKEFANFNLEDVHAKILPVKKDEVNTIKVEFDCIRYLEAPVEYGKIVGMCKVKVENDVVDIIYISITEAIEKKDMLYYLYEIFSGYKGLLEHAII